ncbi:MAG: hypothetical protein GY839_05225 [candidate division Zixibacteria bacterium]|nr:hypothetical protein [candidate division Zixibacteria bacterium]
MKTGLLLLITLLTIMAGKSLQAQTSSCAGFDYSTNNRLRSIPLGVWQLGLTHEYRSVSRLVSGKIKRDDASRARSSRNILLELNRRLTNSLSITAMLTFVQKNHTIRMPVIGKNYLLTRGFGDGFFGLRYSLIPWNVDAGGDISFGLGLKAPSGKSDLTLYGIEIAPDMQPGTGSVDAVLWGGVTQRIHPKSPLSLSIDAMYRRNGTNSREYKFGNEFLGYLGAMFFSRSNAHFTAGVKYLTIAEHKRFSEVIVPNTGGRWVYLVGTLDANYSKKLRWEFSIRYPAYQKVNGTQLSTSYEYSITLLYALNLKP